MSDDQGAAAAKPLTADRLHRAADLSALTFDTTDDIEPIDGLFGQERALDAIRFGTGILKLFSKVFYL